MDTHFIYPVQFRKLSCIVDKFDIQWIISKAEVYNIMQLGLAPKSMHAELEYYTNVQQMLTAKT